MERKKIILFHHCDEIGGAGVSLLNSYRMLKDVYDVKVYIPHQQSKLEEYLEKHGVESTAMNSDVGMISSYSGGPSLFSRTYIKKLIGIRRTSKLLQRIIEDEKPAMVAVNSMTLAWAGKLIRSRGIKSVCFVRETYVNNIGMFLIKFLLDNWFDAVVFISEHDKSKFECSAPLVEVVRNTVYECDFFTPLSRKQSCERIGISEEKFNVLFVGGTEELKGWSVVLGAMRRFQTENINLVVAGKLDPKKVVLNKKITYIGLQANMSLAYRACDLLLFPSISPHQARPVFEAGIFGLPVIISDFEETAENVKDGFNGLTFVPRDSDDLARKISVLYNDFELRRSLGENNKRHSTSFHSFELEKEKLLALMSKLSNNISYDTR